MQRPEEPSTPDDAFFKRVTELILVELARELPDQADRAAALLGLVVTEIAAIEDREERVQICKDARTGPSIWGHWAMIRQTPAIEHEQ